MNDFSQYSILAGGLIYIYGGLRNKQILDSLMGLCFVFLAAVKLSHQTGKMVDAIGIVIGALIVVMAILKLRASRRIKGEDEEGQALPFVFQGSKGNT